jgi:hypothetical protein
MSIFNCVIHVQHEETEESEESEEEEEEEAGVRRSSRRTRVQVFFTLKKLSYFFSLGDFVEVYTCSVSDHPDWTPDSIRSVVPHLDPGGQNTHKNRKK